MATSFVFQLVYASVAVRSFSPGELESLLRKARQKNTERRVTGVLLYEGGMFIQALEGEEADVRQVYAKIGADPRHGGLQVLWSGQVAARSFGEWSMGFMNGASPEVKQLEGYRDFLSTQAISRFSVNPSRGTDLLDEFRRLPWRRAIDDSRVRST